MTEITVTIPDDMLARLREIAELEGMSVEELLLMCVLEKCGINDPETRAEVCLLLCEKYLREAKQFLEKGDYVQASEKAWGAAAEIVKAAAMREGLILRSHGDLYRYISKLVQEVRDPEIAKLWAIANELHRNFYENIIPPELVKQYIEAVEQFIERVRNVLKR